MILLERKHDITTQLVSHELFEIVVKVLLEDERTVSLWWESFACLCVKVNQSNITIQFNCWNTICGTCGLFRFYLIQFCLTKCQEN